MRVETFKKLTLIDILVVILLIIILLQRCGGTTSILDSPKIIRDTVWVHNDTTIYSKPQVIKTIPVNLYHDSTIREYLPDTNYAKLVLQYTTLAERFLAQNISSDSVRIDTNGYIKIVDTVSHNLIKGRSTSFSLKYPIIKETIIIPEKKHNQFYVGGQINADQTTLISNFGAGVLFKNKKDQIFGISTGVNKDKQMFYGISSFWKIKLHK